MREFEAKARLPTGCFAWNSNPVNGISVRFVSITGLLMGIFFFLYLISKNNGTGGQLSFRFRLLSLAGCAGRGDHQDLFMFSVLVDKVLIDTTSFRGWGLLV